MLRLKFVVVSLVALAAASFSVLPAHAQTPDDVFSVNYFSNAHSRLLPDETVRIINPTGQTLCANIYVFDSNQNLNECCSCPITHNGLRTLSVNNDLTDNPPPGTAPLTGGVIKLLSTIPKLCGDPTFNGGSTDSVGIALKLAFPTLRAWITHVQVLRYLLITIPGITEEEFAISPLLSLPDSLPEDELDNLIPACKKAQVTNANGVVTGVCSCGTGDNGTPGATAD
jgi:hypothetical protein